MVLQLWESRSSPTLIRSLLRNQGAFFILIIPPRPFGHSPQRKILPIRYTPSAFVHSPQEGRKSAFLVCFFSSTGGDAAKRQRGFFLYTIYNCILYLKILFK